MYIPFNLFFCQPSSDIIAEVSLLFEGDSSLQICMNTSMAYRNAPRMQAWVFILRADTYTCMQNLLLVSLPVLFLSAHFMQYWDPTRKG